MNTYNKKLLILAITFTAWLCQANSLAATSTEGANAEVEANKNLKETINKLKNKTGKVTKAVSDTVSPAIEKLNNTSDAQIGKVVKTILRAALGIPGLVALWHGAPIVFPRKKSKTPHQKLSGSKKKPSPSDQTTGTHKPDESSPGEGTEGTLSHKEGDALPANSSPLYTSTDRAYKGPNRLTGACILYSGLFVLGSVYNMCTSVPPTM